MPWLLCVQVDRLASAEFRDETARIVRVVGSRLEQPRQTVSATERQGWYAKRIYRQLPCSYPSASA